MAGLTHKLIFMGKIEVLTGIRIGGNSDNFDIGGMDNPVIRDPFTGLPFIPGSSIKGKMRSELEWALHVAGNNSASNDYQIVDLFGIGANKKVRKNNEEKEKDRPTRLLFRDAFPEGYSKIDFSHPIRKQLSKPELANTTIGLWNKLDMGLSFTEWKKENTINRRNGGANPRDMERVPAGSKFCFELVLLRFDQDETTRHIEHLMQAVSLFEDSYLGGSGSRGYGKVKFDLENIELRDMEFYKNQKPATTFVFTSFREIKVDDIIRSINGKSSS
jgi:CRISPR-associated protein Csm3